MGQFHNKSPGSKSLIDMISNPYAQIEQRFRAWALTQPLIEAVIVVGSRARSDHPADEWSDLDLVVFAHDASRYFNEAAWLEEFGPVRIAASHSFGKSDREWLALYDDGVKLDVAFLLIDPLVTQTLRAMLDAFPYPVVLQRGVRVLVDKTFGHESAHLVQQSNSDKPHGPTSTEFSATLNHLLLDAIKIAKFIRRNDLWRAKQLCDGELKQYLLTLLEWQAAMQTDQRDIWYDGRFLDEWADPLALAELPATFATYEAGDMQRALMATLNVCRQLAQGISERLGYTYPLETDQYVVSQIKLMFASNHYT
jgi:aminoglycoside 6-adenylyltransferase